MRKSILASFIIMLSLLIIAPKLYAQVECPCNFRDIPMTDVCWTSNQVPFIPAFSSPITDPPNSDCQLQSLTASGPSAVLIVREAGVGGNVNECVMAQQAVACGPIIDIQGIELTPAELIACQCELQAYSTELNDIDGISVIPGPPYLCGNVDCTPPPPPAPAQVPTLSEWGLVTMAAILGIIGFMVIRGRKVAV